MQPSRSMYKDDQRQNSYIFLYESLLPYLPCIPKAVDVYVSHCRVDCKFRCKLDGTQHDSQLRRTKSFGCSHKTRYTLQRTNLQTILVSCQITRPLSVTQNQPIDQEPSKFDQSIDQNAHPVSALQRYLTTARRSYQ